MPASSPCIIGGCCPARPWAFKWGPPGSCWAQGLGGIPHSSPPPNTPQIASELKGTISTRLRSARNSISVPIASTSDKVLGATLAGCELALGMAKETAEYAANTRVGRLASGGADLALGSIEKVVEFLLPPDKESGICHPDWLAILGARWPLSTRGSVGGIQVLLALLWDRGYPSASSGNS